MKEIVILVVIVAVYLIANLWLLPKLGIST